MQTKTPCRCCSAGAAAQPRCSSIGTGSWRRRQMRCQNTHRTRTCTRDSQRAVDVRCCVGYSRRGSAAAIPFQGDKLVQVPFLHQLRKVLVGEKNGRPIDVLENELIGHFAAGMQPSEKFASFLSAAGANNKRTNAQTHQRTHALLPNRMMMAASHLFWRKLQNNNLNQSSA